VPTSRIETLPSGQLRILAPAKLNLGLRVYPLRPDGFHPLETWMLPTSWHDTLTFSPGGPLQLKVTGRSEGIPTDLDKNLITRAALKLAQHANIPPTGTIELHKVLPPGGGLGGGSSDAANTLVALNHLWNLHLPDQTLIDIATTLGSDIPFFIPSTPALCTGRGEIMTPLPGQHQLFALLIIPPQGCPTKDVYQSFDTGHQHDETIRNTKTDWQHLAQLPAPELLTHLINDLEPPAFHVAPWLKSLRDEAATIIAQPVHMTGSGSTLFTLTSSSAAAHTLQQKLESALPPTHTTIPTKLLT